MTTTKVTLQDLRREAKRLRATVAYDGDCQCYRAEAPHGHYFEPELHEFIAVFGDGLVGNGATKAEARQELMERLQENASVELCQEPDCDWCNS